LLATPALAQDKTVQQQIDELKQEIAALKKAIAESAGEKERLSTDNVALRQQLDTLRALNDDSSRQVLELRKALRDAGAIVPNGTAGGGETGRNPLDNPTGPSGPLRAKVLFRDVDWAFLIINKGEADGVKPGYRFDIMRRRPSDDPNKPDEWRWEKLGVAEFEKYIEKDRDHQSKLKITEGRAEDMKYEDWAVAHRKLEPGADEGGKTTATSPVAGPRKYTITGRVGEAYMTSYGQQDGAKEGTRVFVYREGRLRAQLRLDSVAKDYSIGRLIEGTQNGEFGQNDPVELKETRLSIVGRVKWNDEKRGIVMEIGSKNGVKPGMKFEVRRQGRKIGVIVVRKVLTAECEADATSDLKRDDVFVEDFVESIE
jgi:hypothetical protein